VVSVLFCDMVGFTAASEQADPEDVHVLMRGFHALLTRQIEQFGGSVEKFAGDAVMAMFGVPAVHEDDAERAVRAGLAILSELDRERGVGRDAPHVRVGVNTGEVLVDLDAGPEAGLIWGDVVNTAARIQTAADVDTVFVGAATVRATERVMTYESRGRVAAKGKAERVAVWRALAPQTAAPTAAMRPANAHLVGRVTELEALGAAFERVVSGRSVQMLTVVGEPGVGKTRLLAEVRSALQRSGDPPVWRHAWCLPFGQRGAFGALSEIVTQQLEVQESDDAATVQAKLQDALAHITDGAGLEPALLALLGLGGATGATRPLLLTAWERFLTASSAARPTVVVLEDLHWAEDGLLEFLGRLAASTSPSPLLVLATARPELLDRDAWVSGSGDVLSLGPLSDLETAALVEELLGTSASHAGASADVVAHADGNPLFAEEYVRALTDLPAGSSADQDSVDRLVPQSLQSLLAARLDTLTFELKSLIQDAAVMGSAFPPAALVAIGPRTTAQVREALTALRRRGLLLPAELGSEEDGGKVQFWHDLLRDVAYAQIPRASRARKHLAAADWVAARSEGMVDDAVDTLAHHLETAWELAVAVSDLDLADEIRPKALRAMTAAADRALELDVPSAVRRYEHTLNLADPTDPGYARLLHQAARALREAGRLAEAVDILQRALEQHRSSGDVSRQASVLGTLGYIQYRRGEVVDPRYAQEAVDLLRAGASSEHLVQALIGLSESYCLLADYSSALRVLDEADSLHAGMNGRSASDGSVDNWLLFDRAEAEFQLGDAARLAELESAHEWDAAHGTMSRTRLVRWHRLAVCRYQAHGPRAALDTLHEALEHARRQGVEEISGWNAVLRHLYRLEISPPSHVVVDLLAAIPAMHANGELVTVDWANSVIAVALTEMGRPDEAAERGAQALVRAHRTGDPELLVAASLAVAGANAAQHRFAQCVSVLESLADVVESTGVPDAPFYPELLPRLVRTALDAQATGLADRLASVLSADLPLRRNVAVTCRALLQERTDVAVAEPLFADAAARWEAFGNTYETAHAWLGAARCQQTRDDRAESTTVHRALELFVGLEAGRWVSHCERLLAGA
jgi:class 3 adenylate cyclase/tetratricopeptide (TPR) repeat protein